jgi:hypothetical protein
MTFHNQKTIIPWDFKLVQEKLIGDKNCGENNETWLKIFYIGNIIVATMHYFALYLE